MDINAYLARIDYRQAPKANLPTLKDLQLAHLKAVPFENLDIALKRPIKLDQQSLWDKIIIHKRGGFCYEVNGLFANLLEQIGFDVTYLNARDYHEEDDTFGIDFDHLVLMVKIPNQAARWLVDVGWGDTFTQPLNLDSTTEQPQGLRSYWLEPFRNGYQLWQKNYDGTHERQYFFDLLPRKFPAEYLDACQYHQTSAQSIFTSNQIVSLLLSDGRVSLDNNRLILTKNGERQETKVLPEDRVKILMEYFNINLNP